MKVLVKALIGIQRLILGLCYTSTIADELKRREGVFSAELCPYEKRKFEFEGPSIVFNVYD